jgi:Transposase DDE domain group 1
MWLVQSHRVVRRKASAVRVCHGLSAVFDDPNLVSCAGLAPVMALADRAGLHRLVGEHVRIAAEGGANPRVKVASLVAGMVAGADCIDDMDLLRHGGMDRVFDQARAPSTLGTFLRAFTFGHVRQLDAVAARLLGNLAARTPLLAGADQIAYLDVDDTVRETHGYAKQGAGYGYSGVNGLNALIATVSTPIAAPVIAATRLRKGSVNSARGADRLVADAIVTAGNAGAGRLLVVRADSAFYNHKVIGACRRHGARFSVTARMTPSVRTAIAQVGENSWTPIRYPDAVWDEAEQRWISEAEAAEVPYTAFGSRGPTQQVTARLIVRRVKRLNPDPAQGELFGAWRYHAVFTDSPLPILDAEAAHRGHAVVEQVIADLKNSALAHLPSGKFWANSAWLVCAAIAFNLTRAAGALASTIHARATTATIRAQLIGVPARIARPAGRPVLHLPQRWPWQHAWQQLFDRALHGPPLAA